MNDEIKEVLSMIKEELEKDGKVNTKDLTSKTAINLLTTVKILEDMQKGGTIVEAVNNNLRSYEEALAKCLEAGAKADDDFMYDFTAHYLSTILSLAGNLLTMKDFAKDTTNKAFIKSKIRECLIYIDRL